MPSVKELRERIRSLKSTRQITTATGQVAAARLRHAKRLSEQSSRFSEAYSNVLHRVVARTGTVDHPFARPGRAGAPRGVVVITSDRGLAGSFNANLLREAERLAGADGGVRWYSVGVKGRNGLRRQPAPPESFWPLTLGVMADTARTVAERVTVDFLRGDISEVVLVWSTMVSMLSQKPRTRSVVPVRAPRESPENATPAPPVEFAPSARAVLEPLFDRFLQLAIYSAMLETHASYFAAQLVAMNDASENAGRLIDELTVMMNRSRQDAITTELLEIISGAEALTHRG